jgi:hypothetical protein
MALYNLVWNGVADKACGARTSAWKREERWVMGATGWVYFVPYQEDAECALQDLRNDVFARGAYVQPGNLFAGLSDQAIAAVYPPMADLERLLKMSKAIDKAFKGMGFDTDKAEQDTKGVERLVQDAGRLGIGKAMRKAAGGRKKKRPDSIERALEIAAESGTHSILDIERTSDTQGFGLATPLSSDELDAIFGTQTPSRDLAREKQQQGVLTGLRGRWEAAWFIVFDGDDPREIVFCGHSGD